MILFGTKFYVFFLTLSDALFFMQNNFQTKIFKRKTFILKK